MCGSSEDAGIATVAAAPDGRRRKLWEIDPRLLCSVIGTCLTLGDLHRIERRLAIEPLKAARDFQIHGSFVVWAGQPGPVAKQMHKVLERRYAASLRRFAALSASDDVAALWEASLQDSDVPGPYWAVLTHPATSEDLSMRAFGQVHMLSHLVGAANRADIRRLVALESERDALIEQLAAAKRRCAEQERDARRLVDQHAAELRELAARVAAVGSLEARVHGLEAQLAAHESGESARALRAELDAARSELHDSEGIISAQRASIAALTADTARYDQRLAGIDQMFRAASAECEAMERLLRQQIAPLVVGGGAASDGSEGEGEGGDDARIDLGGRRIVYVGGRGCLIPHLRALVERFGGTFLHHDGGLEEQSARLDALLGQGDAVFCPVDCVSHEACLRAKRVCRQRATAFVPMRTGSLSSFVQGLRQLA
ncbi:MAG: DUF2325 domain-containing protein [Rhodospirillales bacterium]|nr:DUF2325 domain-containing protein [Rhodospirillales bacterium]